MKTLHYSKHQLRAEDVPEDGTTILVQTAGGIIDTYTHDGEMWVGMHLHSLVNPFLDMLLCAIIDQNTHPVTFMYVPEDLTKHLAEIQLNTVHIDDVSESDIIIVFERGGLACGTIKYHDMKWVMTTPELGFLYSDELIGLLSSDQVKEQNFTYKIA